MSDFLYPASPGNADLTSLKPSREFKREVFKVSLSILLFIVVYILLFILAIALAAGVTYLGISLILFKVASFTVLFGLGMIGMGLFVLFFLIKFIFTIKRIDRSSYIEIDNNENPDLQSFLMRLSKETKTKLPKKIYISSDVNASVFYDSSFLSMFFPVRKNLLIGLGLVNSVNLSEFKTIIAHEFGHFSQNSMSLGSYVFNVNKIIYNLLFENKGYAKTIEGWASTNGYFALFAGLTVKIVLGIQWVLQKIYVVVNKTNLSLSRQMEHHADAVSAYVSGSNHMFSALNRLQIGDSCFEKLIEVYNKWIPDNLKPDNIFPHHREILVHFAKDKEINSSDGLPVVDSLYLSKIRHSRVVVKDQWASHPVISERDAYIKSLGIEATKVVDERPWTLFKDPEAIQKKVTELLFSSVKYKESPVILDHNSFRDKYYNEFIINSLHNVYKGFYDGRRINKLDLENLVKENHLKYVSLEEIYSYKNCSLIEEQNIIENDIALLKEIKNNRKTYKSFDFNGEKHTSAEAEIILTSLEKEYSEISNRILEVDKEVFKFFNSRSQNNDFARNYQEYYDAADLCDRSAQSCNEIYSQLNKLYNNNLQTSEAKSVIEIIKEHERKIKPIIKDLMGEIKNEKYLNEDQINKLDWYVSIDRDYIDEQGFREGEFNVLSDSLEIYISIIAQREFRFKKKLLQAQLDSTNFN